MRSFIKFISKYLLSFIRLILCLAILNAVSFAMIFYKTVFQNYNIFSPQNMLQEISALSSADGIADEATKKLQDNSLWAMYLNEHGSCLWSVCLPEEIPTEYTIQDIAVCSKGYIKDYPVFIRSNENGLLVIGYPKNSFIKITANYYPIDTIRKIPFFFMGTLVFDLLILFFAYSYSKVKISKHTAPIISSIETLSTGKPVTLSINGELSEIADCINSVANMISRQNAARANWISGVSHDIRTPLSVIMGYAEKIANNKEADELITEQAGMISRQSIKIKDLVQDLNLVSSLEYEMQPLHKENIRLSKLIRSYATDLINNGLSDSYPLEIEIAPDTENHVIECDNRLITRAISNLVQNSINNNPKGCIITLSLQKSENYLLLIVKDNGIGIPAKKLQELKNKPHYMESTDERLDLRHGLGLLLVKQIVEAHRGRLEIESIPQEGCKISIYLLINECF